MMRTTWLMGRRGEDEEIIVGVLGNRMDCFCLSFSMSIGLLVCPSQMLRSLQTTVSTPSVPLYHPLGCSQAL